MSEKIGSFDVVSFEVEVEVVYILSDETIISKDGEDGWVVVKGSADLLIEGGKRKEQS